MKEDTFSQIDEFKEFFESVYENDLIEISKKGNNFIVVDFSELSRFSVDLAENILNEPIETILKSKKKDLEF